MTMSPEMIGRYRLVRALGTGGFATVYLAEDPRLESPVAIKLLAEHLAADAEFRDRFLQEARLMRQSAAPGLVTVYDVDEHEGIPYFVMEYCERGTLDERLESIGRPLSVSEGLELAEALTECTKSIHRAGLVHRDLKPTNYLLRHTPFATKVGDVVGSAVVQLDEELVLADFGLAKVVDLGASSLTLAGGTPGYSAPEQFWGEPAVDASADVYALSAIVVVAISGVAPNPSATNGRAPFDDDALAVAGPLAEVLRTGVSFDRGDRPSDVMEWYASLQAAARPTDRRGASSQSTMRLPTPPPDRTRSNRSAVDETGDRQKRHRWAALALIGPVVGALLAIGGLMVWRGADQTQAIRGPDSIEAGRTEDYVVAATATDVTWTIGGEPVATGPLAPVSAVSPGPLDLGVVYIDDDGDRITESRTIRITPSPDAPTIGGPFMLTVGVSETYVATATIAGSALYWTDPSGVRHDTDMLTITPITEGQLEISLTQVSPDGREIRSVQTLQVSP